MRPVPELLWRHLLLLLLLLLLLRRRRRHVLSHLLLLLLRRRRLWLRRLPLVRIILLLVGITIDYVRRCLRNLLLVLLRRQWLHVTIPIACLLNLGLHVLLDLLRWWRLRRLRRRGWLLLLMSTATISCLRLHLRND